MANDASNVHPTGAIVIGGENKTAETKKVETGTNVYPGRLVMRGTNDDDVIVCDGSTAFPAGWCGYLDTPKKYRPATITTVHSSSDYCAVLRGPGMRLMGKLAPGVAAAVGDILTYAPAGCLTEATAGTHHVVAVALEAVTTTDLPAADILVVSMI